MNNGKAKRFAIWFALNKSEVHFYSREPSYYGGSGIDQREHKNPQEETRN